MYSIEKIAAVVNGKLLGAAGNDIVFLSADSRRISFPSETMFFAIKKESRDGHQFIQEVYDQGVRCFVVSADVDLESFLGAAFIRVADSLRALQQLAAYHRSQFDIPVIGITGSNGKTIVKEWLFQLLQDNYRIVRSPKSYNSQLGVPLSVWQMNSSHQLGIFEAGISLPGEMEALQKIIQPGIGILTNIGPAHDEGFIDSVQKLEEKLLLFKGVQKLICCTDHAIIQSEVVADQLPVFTWGHGDDCDVKILHRSIADQQTVMELLYQGRQIQLHVGFTDNASVENVMHCIALMLWLNISPEHIRKQLLLLQPVAMRLEWKQAKQQSFILNDSYSNDLASLIIALDYARQQKRGKMLTVILTDFAQALQSVGEKDALYQQVISLLKQQQVNRLFAIGTDLPVYAAALAKEDVEIQSFPDTHTLMEALPELHFDRETIVVKGARHFGLERVVAFLEQQTHQTVLEINLTALAHNLQQYRRLLAPSVKMMVMVKAFGYGSGDAEVAGLLQFNKVDYLAVAYTDEGVTLRKAGILLPIMVMNPEPESFASMEEHNLEPEIFSFEMLESFSTYCQQQALRQYAVHIKIDTGMHRLGFTLEETPELGRKLASQHLLLVKSVFTHLASGEQADHDGFTRQQAEQFVEACSLLSQELGYSFTRHMANTAGIRRHPNLHFDMVRLGIGLYGVDNDMDLQVVTTLKTTVAQVKEVKAGETVGYNLQGKVASGARIATIRIGYADGFRRALSNGKGQVWINGKAVPVIGNVSMDMTMVDITHAGAVAAGDEVEIFGPHIAVQEVAAACDTIAYEILTGISQRVKRVYLQE